MSFKHQFASFLNKFSWRLNRIRARAVSNTNTPPESSLTNNLRCSNCHTVLHGGFCHQCGQKDINFHKPLLQTIRHLVDTWFAIDNKAYLSIITIFSKPGKLSREFIQGKRISYTSPLKMYFFSSLIFFFFLGMVTNNPETDINISLEGDFFTDSKLDLTDIETANQNPEGISVSKKPEAPATETETIESDEQYWDNFGRKAKDNPNQTSQRILKALSYMFFALMPLFALLLKFFFRKKKFFYFEHLIFSVHLHVFGFLCLTVFLLFKLAGISIPYVSWIIFLGMLIYLLLALKHFYPMRWWVAVLRTVMILFSYSFIFFTVMVVSMMIAIQLWPE